MAYNKAAREQLGRLSHGMHEILNRAKRQNRGLTGPEREEWHRMQSEYGRNELLVLSEHSDNVMARLAQPEDGRRPGQPRIAAVDMEEMQDTHRVSRHDQRNRSPHDKAFTNFMRRGLGAMDPDERELVLNGGRDGFRNTASTTVTSQGGAVIPQAFSDRLMEATKWFGGIDGVVTELKTETGAPMPWPGYDDTANEGRILAQNSQVIETDLVFSEVTFNSYVFSSDISLIPIQLLRDSYFDLDAVLAKALGTRIGRKLNNACTLGSGVNQPNGIVTATIAAGNILQFATGNATGMNYAAMVDLEHTVDPSYRYEPSTRWMFHDTMLKAIKLLVDTNGRPLWQPGLSASFQEGAAVNLLDARPTILNHSYIVNMDMAPPTANAYGVLFGDMSKYVLRRVGDLEMMRLTERYADYLQVGFTAFLRADGQLVDAAATSGLAPICVGQQSAS